MDASGEEVMTGRRGVLAGLAGGVAALLAAGRARADVGTEAGTTTGRNASGWDLAQGDLGEAVSRANVRQAEYREWLAEVDRAHAGADLRRRLRALAGQQTSTLRVVFAGTSMMVGLPLGTGQSRAMAGGLRGWVVDLADRDDVVVQQTLCAANGRTLDQLAVALPPVVTSVQPHLTVVHMGTTTPASELATYQARYGAMLDAVLAAAPTGRVLCALVPLSFPNLATYVQVQANEQAANTAIASAVSARGASGRVATVDLTAPRQEWTDDGVHQGDGGDLWTGRLVWSRVRELGWHTGG
jgi:hypothetical protein